ncbi:hypothetical protein IM792_02345 [Mucilaginibacter sp. JRF]|uniref:hypothetical protein n=1 Tax=Mucilaginibacter sp. JRF TaxID=2780088 RepID=UPI0018804A23|nr:hypothetical protein [Mucilaginibacter sp. JRF]MBE9583278.1 hypothetical protein [Mucilaginibacter sp. JRF]
MQKNISEHIEKTDKISAGDLPVITIVELEPKLPSGEEALVSFQRIIQAASRFSGYQTADIYEKIKSGEATEYAIILRFDSFLNLQTWNNSPVKKQLIAASEGLFKEVKPELALTGLEFWFDPNRHKGAAPAAKWKMVLVTVIIIFTLLNTVMPVLGNLLGALGSPGPVKTLLSVTVMVTLMTYLIMPAITSLLRGWLFKASN